MYHLQTNGQTKHVNQELKQFVRLFTNYQQDDWDEHSSTQQVPFMTNTSRLLRMSFEPSGVRSGLEPVNQFCNRIAVGVSEATLVLVRRSTSGITTTGEPWLQTSKSATVYG